MTTLVFLFQPSVLKLMALELVPIVVKVTTSKVPSVLKMMTTAPNMLIWMVQEKGGQNGPADARRSVNVVIKDSI